MLLEFAFRGSASVSCGRELAAQGRVFRREVAGHGRGRHHGPELRAPGPRCAPLRRERVVTWPPGRRGSPSIPGEAPARSPGPGGRSWRRRCRSRGRGTTSSGRARPSFPRISRSNSVVSFSVRQREHCTLKRPPAIRSPGSISWGRCFTMTSLVNQARRSGRLQDQKSGWSFTSRAAIRNEDLRVCIQHVGLGHDVVGHLVEHDVPGRARGPGRSARCSRRGPPRK